MAISVTHAHIAAGVENGNGEIAKAEWNEAHTLLMATGKVLGRTTADDGAVEEIAVGATMSLASGVLELSGQQTGNAPSYAARAWVTFAGSGDISASGNVSSVTDNGGGEYTVNYDTPMEDNNAVALICGIGLGGSGPVVGAGNPLILPDGDVCPVLFTEIGVGSIEPEVGWVAVFR